MPCQELANNINPTSYEFVCCTLPAPHTNVWQKRPGDRRTISAAIAPFSLDPSGLLKATARRQVHSVELCHWARLLLPEKSCANRIGQRGREVAHCCVGGDFVARRSSPGRPHGAMTAAKDSYRDKVKPALAKLNPDVRLALLNDIGIPYIPTGDVLGTHFVKALEDGETLLGEDEVVKTMLRLKPLPGTVRAIAVLLQHHRTFVSTALPPELDDSNVVGGGKCSASCITTAFHLFVLVHLTITPVTPPKTALLLLRAQPIRANICWRRSGTVPARAPPYQELRIPCRLPTIMVSTLTRGGRPDRLAEGRWLQ